MGGAVASWLVCSSADRAVRVRALAGDIVLCSWARHFTLTVPLSIQEYKWLPANCWGNLTNCWWVTCDGLASRPGGVEILLAASCYRNRDKLGSYEPVLALRLHSFFFNSIESTCSAHYSNSLRPLPEIVMKASKLPLSSLCSTSRVPFCRLPAVWRIARQTWPLESKISDNQGLVQRSAYSCI